MGSTIDGTGLKSDAAVNSTYNEQLRELYNALLKDDIATAEGIIKAFAYGGYMQAIEPLTVLLEYHNETIRVSSAMALGRLGDSSAVQPLIKALKDPSENVKIAAATALGVIGDKSALMALESIPLSTKEHRLANAVRSAVYRIKKPGDPGNAGAEVTWLDDPAIVQSSLPKNPYIAQMPDRTAFTGGEETQAVASVHKNPILAAIASFFIPGLGQVYCGQSLLHGFLYVVGTVCGFLLIIPGIIVWLYNVYDAYTLANKINKGQASGGEASAVRLIFYAIFVLFTAIVAGVMLTFLMRTLAASVFGI